MGSISVFIAEHRAWVDALQAAAMLLNVFGWLLSLTLLTIAWRRGRITHLKAFGVSVSLAQEAVVAASRASRVREARDQQIRHPGQRTSSPAVDVEALRAIVDRAFVPEVAERLVGKAVLWVDDNPRNNVYEVEALHKMGLVVELALSTAAALERIGAQPYDLVISDMGRGAETFAGYDLLKALRDAGDQVPYLIFSAEGSKPAHVASARAKGAQGSMEHTNELLDAVVRILGESVPS